MSLLYVAIAGIAVTAYGQIEAGKAAEQQGKFQQDIANRNAEQAQREAEGKRQAAAEAAVQKERQGRALIGKQRAQFAKSGVELRGSPLSVLVETAQDAEADRLTILREGAIAGATDEFRAGILRAEGSSAAARGSAAKSAAITSAIGSSLTSTASASATFGKKGKQPGTT
jgi:hypothetical protein